MARSKSTRQNGNYSHTIFKLLNIYLSLHGLSCVVKFKWNFPNLILFALLTFYILTNIISKLFSIIDLIIKCKWERNCFSLTVLLILELMLIILFFLKRKKLNCLYHHVEKIYSSYLPQTVLKHRNSLIIILLINDIYTISAFFLYYLMLEPDRQFRYLGDNYTFGFASQKSSLPLYIFCVFMEKWGSLALFIPVYFYCFCFALKQRINAFKKKIEKEHNVDLKTLCELCTEISNLTSEINKALHDISLLVFVILLGYVFYHTYSILVAKSMTEYMLLYRISNTLIYFVRFVAICSFASSTSEAGSELKKTIYDLNVKHGDRWNFFHLFIRINEKFVEFKLLDSLVINKNLILAAMGSLVTYGIIIATFNINSKA